MSIQPTTDANFEQDSKSISQQPPTLDCVAVSQWMVRPIEQSAWLHEEVGRRMQERLEWIVQQPQAWCDWEPLNGGINAHNLVASHYPKAQSYLAIEEPLQQQKAKQIWKPSLFSKITQRKPSACFELPEPQSVQMLWANMFLHQSLMPLNTIARWNELLQVNGFLMFSCLGPDSALELRQLYAQQGWGEMGQEFTDMHDWGDMLVQQGFSEPVMDVERIYLEFPNAERLLQELRTLGKNFHPQRFLGLRGRKWKEQLLQSINSLAKPNGNIVLTFEIIYGHAIKARAKMPVAPQTTISLQDMRSALTRHSP